MDSTSSLKLKSEADDGTGYDTSYKRVATTEFDVEDRSISDAHSRVTTKSRVYRRVAVLNVHWWKRIRRESLHDIRHAPWKLIGRRFCSHVLPVCTIAGTGIIISWMFSPIFEGWDQVCMPDGSFLISYNSYSPWHGESVFFINLIVAGGFTFSVAKLIDIMWDVVVGRGGQALLAVFAYRTFTRALTRSMEQAPVSHDTFKAITLHPNTMTSVWMMVKDLAFNRGVRARLAMFWIILSVIFLLSVPTWLSAMTGYVADIQPYVLDSTGNLVPQSDFPRVVYTIHDGQRLGLTPEYHVSPSFGDYGPIAEYAQDEADAWAHACFVWDASSEQYNLNMTDLSCAWMWRISNYTSHFGFQPDAVNSTFVHPNGTVIDLTAESKTLNISAYFWENPDPAADPNAEYECGSYNSNGTLESYKWNESPYGYCVLDHNKTGNYTFRTLDPLYWHNASNTLYNLTEINQQGGCQQLANVRYKWGFSFLLLYIFLALFLVWTIVMFAIYMDAYLHSILDVNRRHLGTERAVLDLTAAMEKRLADRDDNTDLYSNEEIRQLVKHGQVIYHDLPLNTLLLPTRWTQVKRWWKAFSIRPWLKAEKWWLFLLLVFVVFSIVSFSQQSEEIGLWLGWNSYASPVPIVGVLLVLFAGRKVRNRWLVFVLFMILFVVVDVPVTLVFGR